MKLDVTVKNLGQIKEATFQVRPVTLITGPNGTGKSFFTKTLYSILNLVNVEAYHQAVIQAIRDAQFFFKSLQNIKDAESFIDYLDELVSDVEEAKRCDVNYFAFTYTSALRLENEFNRRIKQEHIFLPDLVVQRLQALILHLRNPVESFIDGFSTQIYDELKGNFQIASLDELVCFGQEKAEINIDDLLTFELMEQKTRVGLSSGFLRQVASISSVIFFESPAYWRVRDALRIAKNYVPDLLQRRARANKNILTGVPKYFYELDEALSIKIKTEPSFSEASQRLKEVLGGEFIFNGDDLNFKNDAGFEISKNLVSLGMTNLGLIHALLKQNLLTAGSFVFIDEPETNLHPDWQVELVNVLLLLAKAGVNVVMTTHSQDFAKALEVCIKKMQLDAEALDDFLSVHYLDYGGQLYPFESDNKLQQLIEARELLSLAYQKLYLSDLS